MMRYTHSMGIKKHLHKSIVAALLLGVWFSTPSSAQSLADSERLDLLFEQLLEAEPDEADRIEGQIITEWGKSGSAAMDLLYRRGEDAMGAGTPDVAVEHFTALVDHAPDFAEGYNGRASAYYQMGLYGPAIDDLRQVLVLEPRHFGAMTGVAVMLEEIGRPEDALEVWQRIASLVPTDPEVASMIDRLKIQLQGETL
jgi:tetratricopeptide (TPR) repeat protein